MTRKVVLIADPGIDTSFAVALALHDPNLDVLGIIPCAGKVSASQACENVQILAVMLAPDRWPRISAPMAIEYDRNAVELHGPDGLGGTNFPAPSRHQQLPAEKMLPELIRKHPHEVSVICLGPAGTLARAFDLDPELPMLIDRVILTGGTLREPGNFNPVGEFHFFLDPVGARRVIRSGVNPTIIPLDVSRQLKLAPTELLDYPNPNSQTCQFLRQIVPFGIRASSHLYGIEGFYLKAVLGIAAVALPGSVTVENKLVDIETKGELTRGMLVIDNRPRPVEAPNAQVAVSAAIGEIRQYMTRILKEAP